MQSSRHLLIWGRQSSMQKPLLSKALPSCICLRCWQSSLCWSAMSSGRSIPVHCNFCRNSFPCTLVSFSCLQLSPGSPFHAWKLPFTVEFWNHAASKGRFSTCKGSLEDVRSRGLVHNGSLAVVNLKLRWGNARICLLLLSKFGKMPGLGCSIQHCLVAAGDMLQVCVATSQNREMSSHAFGHSAVLMQDNHTLVDLFLSNGG